jgi:hypothetical protein
VESLISRLVDRNLLLAVDVVNDDSGGLLMDPALAHDRRIVTIRSARIMPHRFCCLRPSEPPCSTLRGLRTASTGTLPTAFAPRLRAVMRDLSINDVT